MSADLSKEPELLEAVCEIDEIKRQERLEKLLLLEKERFGG